MKATIPLKIKIFLWQLFQNVILTRDNMPSRYLPGNPACFFLYGCGDCESHVLHLLICTHGLGRVGIDNGGFLLPSISLAKLGLVISVFSGREKVLYDDYCYHFLGDLVHS